MNTLEAKLWLIDQQNRIWKLFQDTYNCGSVPAIEFSTKKSKVAAFAFYSGKVEYTLSYFCTHQELKELEQIVAHEVAHIVQFRVFPKAKQAHGTEFRSILEFAGYKPDTYHKFSVSRAKSGVKKLKDEQVLFDL